MGAGSEQNEPGFEIRLKTLSKRIRVEVMEGDSAEHSHYGLLQSVDIIKQ